MSTETSEVFTAWLETYDQDQAESGRSYYDSDTGITDYEQARFDDMFSAFDAGVIYGALRNQNKKGDKNETVQS